MKVGIFCYWQIMRDQKSSSFQIIPDIRIYLVFLEQLSMIEFKKNTTMMCWNLNIIY
ncbi:unnamed protein product [Paramecium octaurelia]|uniref:Uncharacterized protein n=1 Tax=Paramecium octaurelia TaxID=43137 RepID=A0A8S1Y226_PAROT|nr:unnamed protein product [Paramecium octaurelia]